jgi:hypothetical protein
MRGAHEAEAFVAQRPDFERRQGLRVVDEPEIGPSRGEPFGDVRREAFDDGQASLRHLLAKRPDQRKRVMARQGRRHRDRNVADRFVPERGQILLRLRHEVQDAVAMVEQPPAGLGELHAATVPQKQRLAQLDLQRAHLAAQSRLRHTQHECCLAEAAVLGHMDEGFELVQIHWPIFA